MHASTLFVVVRRAVPDSVCAYDLGLELSALIGHRWDAFDARRDGTRLAWSIGLAGELIARATARGVVLTVERQRGGEPLMMTLSDADLSDLSAMAHAPLDLDLDPDAIGALSRLLARAPSAGVVSGLEPSHLVRVSSQQARRDG